MQRVRWSAERDAELRELRLAGLTWDAIAESMGLGRNTVLERGRKIGARRRVARRTAPPESADRVPRCAGHPQTWGLLTSGTLLDGAAYPFPVFL